MLKYYKYICQTFAQRSRVCEVARSVAKGNLGEAKRNRIATVV